METASQFVFDIEGTMRRADDFSDAALELLESANQSLGDNGLLGPTLACMMEARTAIEEIMFGYKKALDAVALELKQRPAEAA